jgi:uncharacterized glyoxalase superfamily protein PhnB
MTTFYPSLRYEDAPAAIDWLEKAFGFERKEVFESDDGGIAHAELRYGDGMVMMGSERDDGWGSRVGRSWVYVAVEGDIDAHFERARGAGAEVVREPEDQAYGSRDYSVRDLEGNLWSFGTYRP